MATGNITRLEGVWPETHERAVRDSAGVNLETKLGNINSNLNQLDQKVTEKIGGDFVPILSLEQGAIASSTGLDTTSTTRIRTANYIKAADVIHLTTAGNRVYVMGYKEDGTFISALGWLNTSQDVSISGAAKYRFVFAYSNDANIAPEDFPSLGISVNAKYGSDFAGKEMESEVADLNKSVLGGQQTIDYVVGEYVDNTTGAFVKYPGWTRTDYLNVAGLKVLVGNNPGATSAYNVFYDEKKQYVGKFTVNSNSAINVNVPERAQWCVLSNVSADLRQLTLSNLPDIVGLDEIKSTVLKSQDICVNTATSIEDIEDYARNYQTRIDFILPVLLYARIQVSVDSAYKVSYSLLNADGTTLYDSAWATSINLQDTLYNYPATSRIRLYFKKSDESSVTLADIEDAVSDMVVDYVTSEWNISPDLTIENSILKDIHDLAVGGSGILDLNPEKEVVPKLGNLDRRYISYGGSATQHPPVLSFIHMSDAHADNTNILRIKEFYDKYSTYINGGVIDTGDFIGQNLAQGLPSSISEVPDFIRVLGNHDAYYYVNGTWQLAPQIDCYNVCFKDYIGDWGVVQPENAATYGYCYFYKDFTDSGIMMVALDYDHWDSTQNTWLVNTLATALSLGRHVVILVHRAPFRIAADTSNPFQNVDYINRTFADHDPMTDVYTDVKNFIDGGGNFVCYLCGHLHDDYFGLGQDSDTNNQLVIGVGCAAGFASATVYGTMSRISGQRSQDCFNIVGIDPTSKTIKIMRIGADYDRYMRKKNTLSWNYGTNQLIYVD